MSVALNHLRSTRRQDIQPLIATTYHKYVLLYWIVWIGSLLWIHIFMCTYHTVSVFTISQVSIQSSCSRLTVTRCLIPTYSQRSLSHVTPYCLCNSLFNNSLFHYFKTNTASGIYTWCDAGDSTDPFSMGVSGVQKCRSLKFFRS